MNTQILSGYDNYILFGTDNVAIEVLHKLSAAGFDVYAFCDKNKEKWGTSIEGIPVITPDELAEYVKKEKTLTIICETGSKHLPAALFDELCVPYVFYTKPIFVEITSFCNQSCNFCTYGITKREKMNMDPEIMKAFLQDLGSENSDVLYPTIFPHVLGEPLVSKHFFDFMDICKELNFYVCLVTNWALMNKEIQDKLFSEYPDFDIIFSMQGATKRVFDRRGEKHLTYEDWINLLFEILECKFKYAHKGLMRICILSPEVVNNVLTRSDVPLDLFEWYESIDEFKEWKREFGKRCDDFRDEMQKKYPENFETIKDAKSPIPYKYTAYTPLTDLEQWSETDTMEQFNFAPNCLIYAKNFGTWGADDLLKTLLPDDKYVYNEENWHAMTEKCDRLGDVSLLSSGQLVACNIDGEADYILADLTKGEKYSDEKTQDRLHKLRDNLSLSPMCRRCKSRALVFDKTDIDGDRQEIVHYGIRWHRKRENSSGEVYRTSYELSNAFVFPRLHASKLEIDIESVQSKKQFTLIKILSYNEEKDLFTERKNFSIQLKPGERKRLSIPYTFQKGTLHRVDFITATERTQGVDDGVAVYSAGLAV